ncbi:hypothetical protein E2C01_087587 [Portunus trituberculatus]|uniref:Uncharacterized protein n=1 Tax=Portunus trituberculatus TaxID=210409 RepID=A0A5B7JCW0_PORTR|nr:hypothetical protein [Portunus trituberculatus]
MEDSSTVIPRQTRISRIHESVKYTIFRRAQLRLAIARFGLHLNLPLVLVDARDLPSQASWTRPGAGGSMLPRATRSLLVMLLLCADVVPLHSLDFILAMASQRPITSYFKPSPTSK